MDVKRRGCLSGSQLLDEQELPGGLLGGGFHVHQHPEKPQHLSMLGAECVGGGVDVHRYSPCCCVCAAPTFPTGISHLKNCRPIDTGLRPHAGSRLCLHSSSSVRLGGCLCGSLLGAPKAGMRHAAKLSKHLYEQGKQGVYPV